MSDSKRAKFIFKGNEYSLKEDTLGLLRDVNPILLRRAELIFKYTKSIDKSKIDKFIKKINELTGTVELLKRKNKSFVKEQQELDKVSEDYETDSECKAIILYYEQSIKAAMTDLITDRALMQKHIPLLLDGDTEKLDFADIEIIKFLTDVLQSFFFAIPNPKAT